MSATSLLRQLDLEVFSLRTGPEAGGAFFICEMCTPGSMPSSFAPCQWSRALGKMPSNVV